MIQTILFIAGVNTLFQTFFETRLPAVINASYTFVPTTVSIVLAGRYSDIIDPQEAIDAAALVIQHPDGRLERMFRPVPASEVMRANPGHYVSLIIPLTNEGSGEEGKEEGEGTKKREVRFTRVKLLRPTETMNLGHAYRLVTSQEVMKVLKAKKYGKMMKQRQQQEEQLDDVVVVRQQGKPETEFTGGDHRNENNNNNNNSHNQGMKQQRHGQTVVGSGSRPKSWRPNLQSIAEGFTRTS